MLSWKKEAEEKANNIENQKTTIQSVLVTLDLIKTSEKEVLARLEAAIVENPTWADKYGILSRSWRVFYEILVKRRTDWLSYSVISPYLGNASLQSWAAYYDENRWEKSQTLKKACEALGRCDKELLFQCNEEIRTQFAEAYGDIKKACGNDSDLLEMLKVYQNSIEALQQSTFKKGELRWLEQ